MLTQHELVKTVQSAFEAFDTSDVWWLKFEVRRREGRVELNARTKPFGSLMVASGSVLFDHYTEKEYIVWEVERFMKEACGLGWSLDGVPQ